MSTVKTIPINNTYYQRVHQLRTHLQQRIIGQEKLITRLLIALLVDGHLLVEGAPGLAKTKAVKELGAAIEGSFRRIQFTPDLVPGDLTGTEIYRPQQGSFDFQPGPLFNNLILADEINRAPAKVQSALLEAMGERQITIGNQTYRLPPLFLVMATQNPIEQEGTYPLPEAELDRFLMYVKIGYPEKEFEHRILHLARREAQEGTLPAASLKLSQDLLFRIREQVSEIYLSDPLEHYIVELIMATRTPHLYSDKLAHWQRFGASPRATIALDKTSRAHAWLLGRDYVTPEDIHEVVYDVLRHRILLSFEAEALNVTTDDFITELLKLVALP